MRSWCRTYSRLCLDVTCAQLVTSLEIARKHDKNNMTKRHMIHTMMWWYEGLDRPASLVHVLLDSASQVSFLIVPGAGVTSVQRQHARNAKNQGDIEDTMNILYIHILNFRIIAYLFMSLTYYLWFPYYMFIYDIHIFGPCLSLSIYINCHVFLMQEPEVDARAVSLLLRSRANVHAIGHFVKDARWCGRWSDDEHGGGWKYWTWWLRWVSIWNEGCEGIKKKL